MVPTNAAEVDGVHLLPVPTRPTWTIEGDSCLTKERAFSQDWCFSEVYDKRISNHTHTEANSPGDGCPDPPTQQACTGDLWLIVALGFFSNFVQPQAWC